MVVEGRRIRIKNSAALVNVNAERVVGKVAGGKALNTAWSPCLQ
ncbi:hypothetical protein [Vulcanisaeta sp. EB80]|nr:hypothetical protein [Vulcanisaeta sp. EB80]